jgi:hypothetical protein
MHPGPVNRGVELASEVVDHERSVILDQVTNGVAVRMAALYLLSGGRAAERVPLSAQPTFSMPDPQRHPLADRASWAGGSGWPSRTSASPPSRRRWTPAPRPPRSTPSRWTCSRRAASRRVCFGVHPLRDDEDLEVFACADVVDDRVVVSSNGQEEHRVVIRTPLDRSGARRGPSRSPSPTGA